MKTFLTVVVLDMLLVGQIVAAPAPASALAVNVETFGAIADGHTDNTAAIFAAVASLVQGQTLFFPCSAGSAYLVTSPINFGGLSYMSIQGSGPGCTLLYSGTAPQSYAFSFVGSFGLDIRNMDFFGAMSGTYPQTLLLLGRTGIGGAGSIKFNAVRVEGYATKALVYSIASEENTYLEFSIFLNGGGALYAFYTSCNDDLGVLNLPSGSNLSIWMQNFHITDASPNLSPTHSLIYDTGLDSAAGDHTYRDGYMGSQNGTAFTFYAAGGLAWMDVNVQGIRFENGYQMFNFAGPGSFGNFSIRDNRDASGAAQYLIYLPTACYNCTIEANSVQYSDPTISLIGSLQNSYISENYPVTIGQAINSTVLNRVHGTMQLSSDNSLVCASSSEGSMRYIPGSGGADGSFQICQLKSGSFNWVTH